MSSARLVFSLFIVFMLGACSSAVSIPTQELESTPTQPVDITLPFATITFEPDSCSYDGPQTVPASETLVVRWRIKTDVADVYGLHSFITDEQKSRDELMQDLQGLDMHRPALPAGLTSAGMSIGYQQTSGLNVTIRTDSGPLHGWLYFGCWAAGEAYDVLGPIEIK